jgi:hypothetical protein
VRWEVLTAEIMQTDALKSCTSVPTFHGKMMEPSGCSKTSVRFYQMLRRHAVRNSFRISHEGYWWNGGIRDFIRVSVVINISPNTCAMLSLWPIPLYNISIYGLYRSTIYLSMAYTALQYIYLWPIPLYNISNYGLYRSTIYFHIIS